MNLKIKAKNFAIKAHKGQVRKSDPDKPMIIHPINVGNLLGEYGYDDNVICAGYLHDVVEDTDYTEKDIEKMFGYDVCSLVMGATEPNKKLPWEERKQETINRVKDLDMRHKAIVCCDKISNLEDLRIISELNGGVYDFSKFNRGYDKQKWYYKNVYKSLINNEDSKLPMFIRLKELIDYIFNEDRDNTFIRNEVFNNSNDYSVLKKIHYRKLEDYKLMSVINKKVPYVIEFTGTPRTGKTSLINNLEDFFSKAGFKVEILEEFTTSKKYKKEIKPLLKDKYKNVVNTEIPKYVLKQLEDSIKSKPDIIIIDRSLFDRLVWVDRLYIKGGMKEKEYSDYKDLYIPLIKNKIDIVISTYTDSLTALKRDYLANLSMEKRNFLNIDNVDEYNTSLVNMKDLAEKEKINFYMFDTTKNNQRQISLMVIDKILSDMRSTYLDRFKSEVNK